MDFKSIPQKYRPIPFWSWNEKLETEETKNQIQKMNDVGMGGFFMHARGGLQTEYMGDEWFENVEESIKKASELGMYAWAYDENGWPSGFGDGAVNGLGIEYQQKYLRMSENEPTENVIAKCGEHWFYYDVNPFYVDTLDKKVVEKFIEVSYKPYYERFGKSLTGFFTDEPQISRNGIPWSFVFRDEYKKRYNEDIYEHLEELFLSVNDYKQTRVNFWYMVTDLFVNAYIKQIHDKCTQWGYKLTGHMSEEESMLIQVTPNGACMPHYEYFDIPGMDWLGRDIFDCLTPMQLSSVCEQLGKKQVMAETFALCGHNVSLAELKGIYEWQMVHGINIMCQHLEGYSIRGIRKRDYPPAMYYQQPWWSEYDKFIDSMSRIGMILLEGHKKAEVLIIHPQTTAWSMYDNSKNEGIEELNNELLAVMKKLEQKHVAYHLGDEMIMERYARVENGRLIVGEQEYRKVICSCCDILLPNTQRLLDEFVKTGGNITEADEIKENNVTDCGEITYKKVTYDDFDVHYFVNTSGDRKSAKINVEGQKLDIYSGDLFDFCNDYEFEPWGSLMVIDKGTQNNKLEKSEKTYIKPYGEFEITEPVINMLTLDKCDYYFDGELQEKNGYVLNICERANKLERRVQIHQDYKVNIKTIPNKLYLVCETPEKFKICVNGDKIDKTITGTIVDRSFKMIDISKHVKCGENIISFDIDFEQSAQMYENLKKAQIFESEKNRLVYDVEIEAIYLAGDFSVTTTGRWEKLEKNAQRYFGDFEIDTPKKYVNIKNIERQGFPFFCGELTIEGEIEIEGENPVLDLDIKGINAIRVEIEGTQKVMISDNQLPLKEFGVSGKTKIKLTLINNLRNLLGPHHLPCGESYNVGPRQFFKEPCVWNTNPEWDDNYCLCEMGI